MTVPQILSPAGLNERQLLDPDFFLLDLRYNRQREELPSLTQAHEFSFAFLGSELLRVPKDKYILIICQFGLRAVATAVYLCAKGYPRVGLLAGGLLGWQRAHPELYKKYARPAGAGGN
jgi:rhodanese-related sulfurtransferase